MLKTVDLIKGIDEKYIPMLKMVNIPDFYKCIAQFSGLPIDSLDDRTMQIYLTTWAEHKYKFFKMLGNKIRVDTPFEYNRMRDDISNEITNINKKFPIFAPWLDGFKRLRENKIKDMWDIDSSIRCNIDRYFPSYKLMGSTITHFFKSCLNAPDELITNVAAIFENQKVKATHTISIDPVDMMLASDNPYNWTSCYRLELERDDSHADGCLAAILDNSSLIAYVWNNEGKFELYEKYHFKNIRYKRMRQWLAISDDLTSIHFNEIYPGKDYDDEFEKVMRDIVETLVANHKGIPNKWRKDANARCFREYGYGYSEYSDYRIWTQVDNIITDKKIKVFDEQILCPCGCGEYLPGSYDCDGDDVEYNGEGFIKENFYSRFWCEYADDYCDCGCTECCAEDCENCYHWQHAHPICDLDNETECETPDYERIDDEGIMHHCAWNCSDCPKYKEHFPDEAKKEDSLKAMTDLSAQIADAAKATVSAATTTNTTTMSWDSPALFISTDDINNIVAIPDLDRHYRIYYRGELINWNGGMLSSD